METTNSTAANNALTSMMDVYKKQFNQVSEFYANAFNSLSGQTKSMMNPYQNQSNLFFNNEALKSLFTPFMGFGINNGISNPFDKMVKNVSDYNQNLIGSLSKQFDSTNFDGNVIGDKYQKLVEERNEASKVYINNLAETFNKQMDSTIAANKELQDETNKEFESVLQMSQKFWADVLKLNQTPPPLPNFSKDGAEFENKKNKVTVKV